MNRRLLISVCFALSALMVSRSLGDPSPTCVSESGISLCVQFDNLSNPPVEFFDFEVTFNGNVPSVDLKRGRNTQGILYNWRVWCKDAQGNAANIGEIKAIASYDFDVKVLNAAGGPGAASVRDIRLEPSGGESTSASLSDGNIATLTGDLKLKRDPLYSFLGTIVGTFQIGTVVEGAAPTGPQDYQLDFFGGVGGSGHLIIGELGEGVHTFIGPVWPGGQVTIGSVGASKCTGNVCTSLFILEPEESEGDIVIDDMLPGAVVNVSPFEVCPLQAACECADPNTRVSLTVGQMHGETEEHSGAQLSHNGLGGVLPNLQTLTIGTMGIGAKVTCGHVAGVLTLMDGIGAGAEVELGSLGINPCVFPTGYGQGVLDLSGQPIEGTLSIVGGHVDAIFVPGNIAGQVVNGGGVSGSVTTIGDVTSTGSVALGNVSGTVNLGTLTSPIHDVQSGELAFGDVSGTLIVYGSVTSGGTITTDDVASSGVALVSGDLAGGFTVGGTVAGEVHVGGNIAGPVTVAGDISGVVHGNANLSHTISVGGNLVSASGVRVDGNMTGNGTIDVTGKGIGGIEVSGTMASSTLVKVRAGLESESIINVNSEGGPLSSTSGTIWIGGSVTQNPMPVLPMLGTILINCDGGTFATGGKVKLVGCAPFEDAPADICILGTNNGQIVQTPVCLNLFAAQCTSSCP